MADMAERICHIEGCSHPSKAKGLCSTHYSRWEKWGDPYFSPNGLAPGQTRRPDAERFWEKVDQSGDCWIWIGARSTAGYGRFWPYSTDKHSPTVQAHRWAYEVLVGSIPPGLHLDHLCRVRECVNPSHLEPVTNRENCRRGLRGPQSECQRGHLFDEENTYVDGSGRRRCRECQSAAFRRRRAVQKGRVAA